MSAARIVMLSTLSVAAACATTRSVQSPARTEELEATVNNLRAQNAGYVRQIEELQNRIFILEDKLDSHSVASERRSAPRLPSIRLSPPEESAPPPELPESLQQVSESVEYAGDAARTSTSRPVLKMAGEERAHSVEQAEAQPSRRSSASSSGHRSHERGSSSRSHRVTAAAVSTPAPLAAAPIAAAPAPLPPASAAAASRPAPVAPVTAPAVVSSAPARPTVAAPAPAAGATPRPAATTAAASTSTAPRPAPTSPASAPAPAPVAAATSPHPAPAPAAPAPVAKTAASTPARAVITAPAPIAPPRAPEPDSAALAPVAGEPLRAYRGALELLRAGKRTEALLAFRQFIERNPGHDYADNAQYWIGECYYDQKDYRAAVREFRTVAVRFPHGNKVPDAMLKMGFSYLELKETPAARQVLEELVKSYPSHPSASLAQARLASLGGRDAARAKTGSMEARR